MSKSAYRLLANSLCHGQFELSIAAENGIRHALIDTLGCMLAGSHQSVVSKVANTVAQWGVGDVPVYGRGFSTAAP